MDAQERYKSPAYAIEALARHLYPVIVAYFESEEGQREFAEWQATQGIENLQVREAEVKNTLRQAA